MLDNYKLTVKTNKHESSTNLMQIEIDVPYDSYRNNGIYNERNHSVYNPFCEIDK